MPRKRSKTPGGKGYWALPKAVMEHDDFRTLDPYALKVLVALGTQYNGKNNGDLSVTLKTLKDHGGMASATLTKALKTLKERDLIRVTRPHVKHRSGAACALYALSWLEVNECRGKGLDEDLASRPPRRFR